MLTTILLEMRRAKARGAAAGKVGEVEVPGTGEIELSPLRGEEIELEEHEDFMPATQPEPMQFETHIEDPWPINDRGSLQQEFKDGFEIQSIDWVGDPKVLEPRKKRARKNEPTKQLQKPLLSPTHHRQEEMKGLVSEQEYKENLIISEDFMTHKKK